jgi:UDPglucose--hexose-1-phosphate uridylyltransferase
MEFNPSEQPHRRYDPLSDSWVLASPHRARRPWLGQVEHPAVATRPAYDPTCYLCPGNARAGGLRNPAYTSTFVFTNDFSALLPDTPVATVDHGLLRAESEPGTCRVACFSPRHDLSLAELSVGEIAEVVGLWQVQSAELGRSYRWVQVFENKGEIMGASNPHPHCQLWAGTAVPDRPAREDRCQRAYLTQHGTPLLADYLQLEVRLGERTVVENAGWLAVVPYWAVWPFEMLLLPREPVLRLPDLTPEQTTSLADILKKLLLTYDRLFDVSFPYSMGWHGAPFEAGDFDHWRLHAHFYPPLLRSATVKKFMVGYEMLAEAQRDLTPEQAAEQLRKVVATG